MQQQFVADALAIHTRTTTCLFNRFTATGPLHDPTHGCGAVQSDARIAVAAQKARAPYHIIRFPLQREQRFNAETRQS
ncbi:hypothetical protein FBZ86_1309 [Gluconacetobacter diazotrophicus]|nr:hypothetical protein FBZ86_1309 [Gluconacetobacter diazotrophicus]